MGRRVVSGGNKIVRLNWGVKAAWVLRQKKMFNEKNQMKK